MTSEEMNCHVKAIADYLRHSPCDPCEAIGCSPGFGGGHKHCELWDTWVLEYLRQIAEAEAATGDYHPVHGDLGTMPL